MSKWYYITMIILAILSSSYVPDGRTMYCISFGGEYKHCLEFLSIKKEAEHDKPL
jgi:hypothetical protein